MRFPRVVRCDRLGLPPEALRELPGWCRDGEGDDDEDPDCPEEKRDEEDVDVGLK